MNLDASLIKFVQGNGLGDFCSCDVDDPFCFFCLSRAEYFCSVRAVCGQIGSIKKIEYGKRTHAVERIGSIFVRSIIGQTIREVDSIFIYF